MFFFQNFQNGAKHSPSSFPWTALRDENVILRLTVTFVEKLKYFVILAWNLIWDLKEGVINRNYDMRTLLWSGFQMTTSIKGVCNTQGVFAEKNMIFKIWWKSLAALPSFSCWCLDISDRYCNSVRERSFSLLCNVNSQHQHLPNICAQHIVQTLLSRHHTTLT